MNRSIGLIAVIVACINVVSCVDDPARPQADVKPQFSQTTAGRYIVSLRGNDINGLRASVEALGGKVELAHAEAGIAAVSGLTPEAAAQLGRGNGVAAVQEDVAVRMEPEAATLAAAAAEQTFSSSDPTTALLYSWQWHLRRIGADVAWAAGRLGSPDVTVAILDTGIDTENLDLAGRVDLTRSHSFMPGDDAFMDTWLPTYPKIEDLNFHGTHVAAQVVSNGYFFAGVTSRVKLIAVKVLDREQSSLFSTILFGVLYAADQGADVANMSLRIIHGADRRNPFALFPFMNVAFNYAHRKGMLLVVIPGNEAEDMDHDGPGFRPYCDAPHVICVSATGPTASVDAFEGPWENEDAFAPYSNYGKAITLSAPGGTFRGWISAVCARHRVTGFIPNTNPPQPVFGCLTPTPSSAFLRGSSGTSLAAPLVSGLAALLVEDLGKNNPSAIKNALIRSVDDLGAPGHDRFFGAGRINVPRALGLR